VLRERLTVVLIVAAFAACFRESADRIELLSQASLSPATVALDGRRASCAEDELRQGSNRIEVGNVLSPSADCPAEVAVFADSHAMQLLTPVAFTDQDDDVVPVNMTTLINVPLAVWIMFQNPTQDREREVETEVIRATQLFDMEQCGIEFNSVINVQTTGFDFELLDSGCERLSDFKNVRFDAGRINVYYIRSVHDNQGQRCEDGASDVLLIGGSRKDSETLAHELGHATSLGDLKPPHEIGTDNLMLSPGSGRNSMSLGQCFRSNVNTASVLNRSQIRMGPTRNCPDTTESSTCPRLVLQ
jgi:hypothetical protein